MKFPFPGEVSNEDECINYVKKYAQTTRVFTFGIGNEISKQLIVGLAEAGQGNYEFITPHNMDEKVLKLLDRALRPGVTNVRKILRKFPSLVC